MVMRIVREEEAIQMDDPTADPQDAPREEQEERDGVVEDAADDGLVIDHDDFHRAGSPAETRLLRLLRAGLASRPAAYSVGRKIENAVP